MKGPAVSVLLPFHDGRLHLGHALKSLARQSMRDFEVVMVDDGSTDDSPSIARSFAKRDRRFRLVRSGRVGLAGALNRGLEVCRASLVCRMDSDDYSLAPRVERQFLFMEAHPELTLSGCLVKIFPGSALKGGYRSYLRWLNSLVTHEDVARDIFVESPFAHPSVMFKKDHVTELGGYRDLDGPEDYDLWLRLFLAGRRMAKVPEVLLLWREWAGRLSRNSPRYRTVKFWRLKGPYLASLLKERGLDGREILVWGRRYAGRLAKELMGRGVEVSGFITIDPERVGRTRLGLPVFSPDVLGSKRGAFVISAVSTRGARSDIRKILNRFGLRETLDFLVAG